MESVITKYTAEEAFAASLEYFNGDELAANVFVNKYAMRDSQNNLLEKSPDDTFNRVAKEYARIEAKKFKKPMTFEEIKGYLDHFKYIVPQGSPLSGIGNPHQYVTLANCYGLESPFDSYGGIHHTDQHITQICKRRGGAGVDLSELRPDKTPTTNSAKTSTGALTFAMRYSNSVREVGQGGRRGALMISQNIHHPETIRLLPDGVDPKPIVVKGDKDNPDIHTTTEFYDPDNLDFASIKYDKQKVTGANISIKITDEFMSAVFAGKEYEQRWPVNSTEPKISKKVNAKRAWKKLIQSAWQMGEPGVLFWDNILRESPSECYASKGFKTVTTNPCSEISMSSYGSCHLQLLNIFSYVKNPFTKKAEFDYELFFIHAGVSQRLIDDLIDLELECIDRIVKKVKSDPEPEYIKSVELELWKKVKSACENGRRTGTGITGLGDALAALGIKYGSEESIKTADKIYRTLKLGAYRSSVDMAKELGPFPIWNWELEKDNPFLNRIKDEDAKLYSDMKKYGRRNIALLTTPPAGSMSILTQTTSGIEPLFDLNFVRRKKLNPNEVGTRVDFVDESGDKWQEFEVYPAKIKMWMDITGEKDLKKSPWAGATAEEIDWVGRIKLQAIATKHVCHSISSTINLPENVTPEKVAEIYETAYKLGCKGMTVYRKNCRSGVLGDKKKKGGIIKTDAPKRPKELPCDVHHVKITKRLDKPRSFEYIVAIGLYEGDPYEVFAFENGKLDKKYIKGKIVKATRGKYDMVFEDGTKIADITQDQTSDEEVITRAFSMELRHGVPVQHVIHQLEKSREDLSSFVKSIARSLKKYVADGVAISGEDCEECAKKGILGTLIRSGGCPTCKICAWSPKCS